MTVLATDDFERADANTLGANWSNANGGTGDFSIVSGVAVQGGGGAGYWQSTRYYNAVTPPADQWAEVVLGTMHGVSDQGVGPAVRMGTAAPYNLYFVQANSVETRLYKRVSGSYTQLGSDVAACAIGDTVRIEASGTSITVKRNGAAIIGPITDTSLASGRAGAWGADGGRLTTWSVGDFAGGGSQALEGAATGGAAASADASVGKPLAGAATAGASAAGGLNGTVDLAGAATAGAQASGALTVRRFQFTLYNVDGATPLANKTGLWWAWWDVLADVRSTAPDASGTGATTDASGVFSVVAPSALTPGDNQGFGIISDQDATPDATEAAYVGSFDVV